MIEQVLKRKNLYKAYQKVVRNKGASGVDNMSVDELFSYLEDNRNQLMLSILNKTYVPKPIRGVEIPKSNGKMRLLGIPTVVDRWLQQAVSQVLSSRFELSFEEHSYGFRPEKNIHKAVTQSLTYINSGYQDIVDIDLKGFFDEVEHSILLQLIYNRMKCPLTLRLIRKWLRAPILIKGRLQEDGQSPKALYFSRPLPRPDSEEKGMNAFLLPENPPSNPVSRLVRDPGACPVPDSGPGGVCGRRAEAHQWA